MTNIRINVNTSSQEKTQHQLVKVSVPFSQQRSFYPEQDSLSFLNSQNEYEAILVEPLAYWPNGKVKWAMCYISNANLASNLPYLDIEINHELSRKKSLVTSEVISSINNNPLSELHVSLTSAQNNKVPIVFRDGMSETISNGQLSVNRWKCQAILPENDKIVLSICAEQNNVEDNVRFGLTIHNKDRAKHPGGKWDLGDENSFYFNSLEVHHQLESQVHTLFDTNDRSQKESGKEIELTQHSSGGENSFSSVHVDNTRL